MKLQDYFASHPEAAFEAYEKFARGSAWSIPNKMNLYLASASAFTGDQGGSLEAFHTIYSDLVSHWQVFRPHGADECWDEELIWRTLSDEFHAFSQSSAVTLKNFNMHKEFTRLREHLLGIEDIKPNNDYPIMAASKFLHFFNPALFPIYDTAIVGNRVFKCFADDYRDLCAEMVLDRNACGADFIINYMCWGSQNLSAAAPDFMERFARWLSETLPPKQFAQVTSRLSTLHATAFEFTAIGATIAEGY